MDMTQWILILLSWILAPICHNLLLKWIPYRWLINSIAYPYLKYKISKRYELMNKEERQKSYCDYALMDHWAKEYWFTKRLIRHILLNYLDDEK